MRSSSLFHQKASVAKPTGAFTVTRAPLRPSPSERWTTGKGMVREVLSKVGRIGRARRPMTSLPHSFRQETTLHDLSLLTLFHSFRLSSLHNAVCPHSLFTPMPVCPLDCACGTRDCFPPGCPLLRGLAVPDLTLARFLHPCHPALSFLQDPQTNPVQEYSSRGPCIVNGETRNKPDTTAADGVSTSTEGNGHAARFCCSFRDVVMLNGNAER